MFAIVFAQMLLPKDMICAPRVEPPIFCQVTLDEFIEGIMRCKGPARAIDQAPALLIRPHAATHAKLLAAATDCREDAPTHRLQL